MCRSRRELSNAYLLPKFGLDTAENEPSKVWPSPPSPWHPSLPRSSGASPSAPRRGMRQTFEGSFSFESSRRDLHNAPCNYDVDCIRRQVTCPEVGQQAFAAQQQALKAPPAPPPTGGPVPAQPVFDYAGPARLEDKL